MCCLILFFIFLIFSILNVILSIQLDIRQEKTGKIYCPKCKHVRKSLCDEWEYSMCGLSKYMETRPGSGGAWITYKHSCIGKNEDGNKAADGEESRVKRSVKGRKTRHSD